MQELNLLHNKIEALLKKYADVKAENARLKEAVTDQVKQIEALNNKLGTLEENMMAASIGTSMLNDKDREVVRKQLDNVIGEIDKILATLND